MAIQPVTCCPTRSRRFVTRLTIWALLLQTLVPQGFGVPHVFGTPTAHAQTAAPRALAMTRADYEACQAQDEAGFKTAIERLTRRGLDQGLQGVDYAEVVSESWRRQNLDDVVDKLVDRATEEVKGESSWGQLLGSLWTKEKAQQLAITVAERVYKSDDMKRALEGLAIDMGSTLGKRIEAATIATAGPAVECLEVYLGPRYGRTIARVVSTDVGKEYSVDAATGQGSASAGSVISQGAGGITGAIILIMRRQLANLASRIGARIVGSVLARIVSVSAGGIGVVLIAMDVWSLRHGVLPIIATEMKARETKTKVKNELAKEVQEQIGENVTEVAAQTAMRVVEIWQEFKRANTKVVELAETDKAFRAFVDQTKPEHLPRLTEAVGLISRLESDGAVLKRLQDKSLSEMVTQWSPAAFEIAREAKSVATAGEWRQLAGKEIDRIVELGLHKVQKPNAFSQVSLGRLLALNDTLAITRLAGLDERGREAFLALGAKDARELARSLDGKQLTVLGSYVPALSTEASARLMRAVATAPQQVGLLARPTVRDGIIGSADQNAALGMILASSGTPNPFQMLEHVKLVTDGRVKPILLWEKHPGVVAGLALALLLTLLMLKRLLFRRKPRVVVERRVEIRETRGDAVGAPKPVGPFKGSDGGAPRIKTRE